jgi:hypothetical protein
MPTQQLTWSKKTAPDKALLLPAGRIMLRIIPRHEPMEIRTEVEIAAPPSQVWRTLTDFADYREWNPFITEISGKLQEGQPLQALLSLPEGRDYRIRPRLLRCAENEELRWRGHLLFPGLFDGEHFFRLEERGPNRTRFVQGENFTGILIRFSGTTITRAARGFVYMNEALKKRVERNARAYTPTQLG